jgi:8-oxo-dGTP diphosphatase
MSKAEFIKFLKETSRVVATWPAWKRNILGGPLSGEGYKPMKSMVCGFMFDSIENVVLIEKIKPAWQKGRYNGVGGKIEPGENAREAMVREFMEETGVQTKLEDWTWKIHLLGPDYEVYFFSANVDLIPALTQTTAEKPLSVDSVVLPEKCLPNLRWLIPLCNDLDLQFPVVVKDRVCEPGSGTNTLGDKGMTARTAKAAAC